MAFCASCGKEINEGVRFCPGCGKAIGASNTSVFPNASVVPTPSPSPAMQEPVREPQVQINNATNTTHTAVSCQGCLLNEKSIKCTNYNYTIAEAEKYDCGIRGKPELQKKQDSRNSFLTFIIFMGALIPIVIILTFTGDDFLPWKYNTFFTVIFGGLFAGGIYALIKYMIPIKNRKNAKRFSY